MEKIQNVVIMISSILSAPVVILLIALMFKKTITEKIKGLLLFELAKGDFNTKMLFYKIEDLVAIKEKPKKKSTKYPINKLDEVNTPKTIIPHIYSEIEEAIKLKLKLKADGSCDMIVSLYKDKIIDTDMFIILDSMRALRDNIYINACSREISEEEIAHYRYNANRIIKIIENMDMDENA